MHCFDLVVDCRRLPSDPGLCHLAHLGRSLSESIEGPDSLGLWTRPLRSCCHGSESILSSCVCGSLHQYRGRASLYPTNHSPCIFCERLSSSSGAGSSLVGSYALLPPLPALGGSLPRSHSLLHIRTLDRGPLRHLTRPHHLPANELLQTVLGGQEVGGALQKIPKILLVGECGLLAA